MALLIKSITTNDIHQALLKISPNNKLALQIIGVLLVSAAFLIWFYPMRLDVQLSNLYFDVASNSFNLKHQFFLETIMHNALKNCMRTIGLGALVIAILGTIRQYKGKTALALLQSFVTNPYFFVFAGMFIANSVVGIVKHLSVHGCPNDLLIYGGDMPLLRLFADLPVGVQAGHCFPGGHASGGFALASFYFAFKDSKPTFAKTMLVLSLVLGFAMGWAQIMRGEHFLSHNLWSAWVVWLVLLVLFTLKKIIEKN